MSQRFLATAGGGPTLSPFSGVASWTIARASGNPKNSIPAGETNEQYVPAAWRMPNGDIYFLCKGQSRLYLWKSTDNGATFSIQNGGTAVLVPGAGSAWDHTYVLEATVIYDEATDTIHAWYKGYPGPSGSGWSIGHATAPGSTPTVWTKDPANPILLGQDVAVHLGGQPVADLALSSVIELAGTYYFYGYVEYDGVYSMWYSTGSALNVISVAAFTQITNLNGDPLNETPDVVSQPDGSGFLMLYTGGTVATFGAASVYTARSSNGTSWTDHSGDGAILAPTGTGWEQIRVYSGRLVKSNSPPYSTPYRDSSGRLLYFYSGLSAGDVALVGLAYIAT